MIKFDDMSLVGKVAVFGVFIWCLIILYMLIELCICFLKFRVEKEPVPKPATPPMADELAVLLRQIHMHNLIENNVFFEQDGKPIEICTDLGDAYADSEMCERIEDVLMRYRNIKDKK